MTFLSNSVRRCVSSVAGILGNNDAPSIGVEICRDFNVPPSDLYYKWESIVLNAIGARYIDSSSPSALKTFLRSNLSRTALAQTIKVEPGLRKTKGAPVDMLGLGSRMKFAGVGLVDTALKLQPSSAKPRVGKLGSSKIGFECHDIEDVSQDKRNCTRHDILRHNCSLSICD
jgi:DNA polymerase alpha subunit B